MTKALTETLRKTKNIDWQRKAGARAHMRMLVKRLLKKYKYPPEGMEDAVKTVMSQCAVRTDNLMEQNDLLVPEQPYTGESIAAESAPGYGRKI